MVNYASNKRFGDFGEMYVALKLDAAGIDWHPGPPADLVSGDVSIEVKIARLTTVGKDSQRGFQFCLRRSGHTDFDADFLVLLCCPSGNYVTCAYVIPGENVDHKNKAVIPSKNYVGKWLKFKDAWHHIFNSPGLSRKG